MRGGLFLWAMVGLIKISKLTIAYYDYKTKH